MPNLTIMGMPVITSNLAVKQSGEEDREVTKNRGGFWERVFDTDPTLPLWQKTVTEIIKVPHFDPVLYVLDGTIICHPYLYPELLRSLEAKSAGSSYKW